MGILGVILGIVAVVAAIFATFLFGTTGGVVTAILAVIAILLGVLKRRKDKKGGIAAIVIAVLAIIMAFGMTNIWSTMFKDLRDKAVANIPDGIWAQVSEDTNNGLIGIIRNMPNDDASLNAFIDEMNELNKID